MSKNFSPIAIFCFNRPESLKKTIDSLKLCNEFHRSQIFVFSDGPRHDNDVDKINKVRSILEAELPQSTVIIARESNVGLAANIIDGVGSLCSQYGRVIVLEDDLIFHHQFLEFMNASLNAYQDCENILQIAGHLPTQKIATAKGRAFLLPITCSWGWATWDRAWKHFDSNAKGWDILNNNLILRKQFNLGNRYDYYTMLRNQMLFNINSWAIRWYWSVFKSSGLVVYPPFNLIDNSGMSGDGSHGRGWFRKFGTPTVDNSLRYQIELPKEPCLNPSTVAEFNEVIWRQNGKYLGAMLDKLKRAFWKIRFYISF